MRLGSICFLSLLVPVAALADYDFTDSTLDLLHYTSSSGALPNTMLMPPVTSTGTSASYRNCSNCGVASGEALQEFVMTPPSPGGGVSFGLINNTYLYNPAVSGAIDSVSASVDQNVSFDRAPGGGFTTAFFPLILQSGNYFLPNFLILGNAFTSGQTTSGFETICAGNAAVCNATPLMATDFTQYAFTTQMFGSANPDFSGTAAPLLFGIAPTVQLNDVFSVEADYNNLSFDIAPAAVATVPEPSTFVLLTLGLACLAHYGFRGFAKSLLSKTKRAGVSSR